VRKRITVRNGPPISYQKYGSGPPLVLVHGAFSDDDTNWEFIKPILRDRFTVYAIARRGRGETEATHGHLLEDEAHDVVALIGAIGLPVFLLGHSYGAHCALAAAALTPGSIQKLILYEAPWPRIVSAEVMKPLEVIAAAGEWEEFTITFFRDTLFVPARDLEQLRATELWPPIIADAKASLGDLRALSRYDFNPKRFGVFEAPVLLQIGSQSLHELYVTDALAAALPNAQIENLPGQAHEGMTTAPEMFAEVVTRFLLS